MKSFSRILLKFAPLLIATVAIAQTQENGLDLTGVVQDPDGKPIAGADVFIDSAYVKKGYNPLCPSCYADCAKRAVTDYQGHLILRNMDPDLRFNVLVVAEGFQSQLRKGVDPAKGPAKLQLKRLDLEKLPPNRVVRGRVVDDAGAPIAGATLAPSWFKTEKMHGCGPDVFDALAVTNAKGEFVITSQSPVTFVQFLVKARGQAPLVTGDFVPEKPDQKAVMKVGATISGRLLHDGKPLAHVGVGLVQADRDAMKFVGDVSVQTNDRGEFSFTNIATGQDYFVYGLMESLKPLSVAVPIQKISVKADSLELDLGTLQSHKAHRLSGRVVLADGSAIPEKTMLMVSRDKAWDHQLIPLDADGTFEITGLPTEAYGLYVRVPGFEMSSRHNSLDLYNGGLIGTIDADLSDMLILMEKVPDPKPQIDYNALAKSGWDMDKVKASRLEGVRMEEVVTLLNHKASKPKP